MSNQTIDPLSLNNVILTVEDVSRKFFALDYVVFCTLMLLSFLIGVYFAFFAKQKQNTTKEYLMGGKNMQSFPITMSLIASYVSGVSILGVPAEVYTYGSIYGSVIFGETLVCIIGAVFFMPVFYRLQLYSSFEYLELRYDNSVRTLLAVLYSLATILYTPLIIYTPSLAFSQVTGISLEIICPAMCAICIFYTSLGGLKAVVWTDTLQSFFMISGSILVAVIGTSDVGGFSAVLERASETDRLEFFDMDPNPLKRHTFWTLSIGTFFMWLAHLVANPAILQRCLAVPTLRQAKQSMIILSLGVAFFIVFTTYTGLVIFAKYHDCDPVTTKAVRKVDQILPFTVMDISTSVPGLPGLFIAGVFSAALSSMSTMLNSLSGVIMQDFIRPHLGKRQITEETASNIMKIIVVLIGIFCTGLTFLVDKLGAIIQVSRTVSGVTAGAMLGIFVLGMLVPWLNAKGALYGGISSLLMSAFVGIGSQMAIAKGTLRFQTKPLSIDGCIYSHNNTDAILNEIGIEETFWLFRISYLYLTLVGFFTMCVVGAIVTIITGPNEVKKMNKLLFSHVIYSFLPENMMEETEYESKEQKRLLNHNKSNINTNKVTTIEEVYITDDPVTVNNIENVHEIK